MPPRNKRAMVTSVVSVEQYQCYIRISKAMPRCFGGMWGINEYEKGFERLLIVGLKKNSVIT